ncbi:hypothetical protein GCM10010384_68930 [Streptomyces djakartensis]|uniref:Repa n=1 Tax=Streptomyces djakartensis TaxID=68193 RepID=A0ABQ3AJS4_9ACTN|nr:hypothetical protein GCM10010384_68930 [Streptomyces djakartensis]
MQKTMAKYTKRRDKRGYEWKSAYREKEALMLERGYPEVSPHDFYRELFPAGSLQQEPEDGKGNIIATQIRPSGKGRTRQWVIDDSLKMLDKVIGDRFGLIPPISFYGKSHTKENAHELFAVVVDVDYVGKQQLKNLLKVKKSDSKFLSPISEPAAKRLLMTLPHMQWRRTAGMLQTITVRV